jgi:hypothetical protein
MGRVLSRAIEAAGLAACQARVLEGGGLSVDEVERLRSADLLLVAGLADQARAQFRGEDVQIMTRPQAAQATLVIFEASAEQRGPTGAEVLREIAL